MGPYLPIIALLVLAVLFCLLSFLASKILAPRRATVAKAGPYESGIVPGKEPPARFPVRFYLIAMIFIVFDIEIIFLYPWAVAHRELGLFGLMAVVIFAASVFESFLYLLSRGALEWGPIRRAVPQGMIGAERTSASTIRRVGTEGRFAAGEQDLLAALDSGRPAARPASAPHGASAPVGDHPAADQAPAEPADDRSSPSPASSGVQ